jgi:hypothetical protein
MSNTRSPERTGRVRFDDIKLAFPLTEVMSRELGQQGYGRQGQRMFRCPFHEDQSPSLSVKQRGGVELFKCHAGSCGEAGSVLDFVWLRHPDLRNNAAATLAYLTQLTGRSIAALTDVPASRGARPLATERHEAGGTEIERARFKPVSLVEVAGRHRQLREGVAYDDARRYAARRGWLYEDGDIYGAQPFPVGVGRWYKGWLSQFAVPAFPKLIRTRRTAFVLGREKEFDENRELCIGLKLRLTPRVLDEYRRMRIDHNPGVPVADLEPSRYWCLPGYAVTPPGEIDANEDAEVLLITEGPGDGVRLYHEAHLTPESASNIGNRWHVTYAENAGTWTPASLERRTMRVPLGGGKFDLQPVSFFDGYRLIVLLFDADEGGRDAARMAEWLAHRQAPATPVKNVALPEGCDLGEFFDRGSHIRDLCDLIAATPATRGSDSPLAPAPLNAAQRRRLADEQQQRAGAAGRAAA